MADAPKRFTVEGLLIVGIMAVAVVGLVFYVSPSLLISQEKKPSYPHLPTGGTSVADFLFKSGWKKAYQEQKGVEIDYESTGSTQGIESMLEKKTAVGFTHSALTEKQKEKARSAGGEVVHIPVVLCAVVPIYNVPELKDPKEESPLKFTGEVLAAIFLGKVKKWNDPALEQLNPGVNLPEREIKVVHRKDSSGTTFIFADYLAKASEAWKSEMGPAKNTMQWKVGEGMERNHGVADHVYRTAGAIGYVDLQFAGYGKIPYGAVQNKDKTAFIQARPEHTTAALEASLAEVRDDLTFELTNRPGKKSYPICGGVWAVCYQSQPRARHAQVVDFLRWITHDGQEYAEKKLSYARLPEELVKRVDKKLEQITPAE
jgi:phosphate transport system substrate-binding protein